MYVVEGQVCTERASNLEQPRSRPCFSNVEATFTAKTATNLSQQTPVREIKIGLGLPGRDDLHSPPFSEQAGMP